MWSHSLFDFQKSGFSRISARPLKVRQRPRSFRPRLETLEDRTLLSGGLSFADPIDINLIPYRSIGRMVLSEVAMGCSWVAPNIKEMLGP